MGEPSQNDQLIDLSEQIGEFLREHPEVKDTLDLFGISYDRYQQYIVAQQASFFYTASSTIERSGDGELD